MRTEAAGTASAFDWLENQFHRLAALGEAERCAELDRLRARTPTLTSELESLLLSELRGEGLPAATWAGAAEGGREPADAHRHIGPYRLEREIGRGGMGVVYEAEQSAPLRRRVAVKVLSGAWSALQLQRFESERLTLARMSHPNVAAVYDAGSTSSGCPFFVMELVDGTPITHAADACRADIEQRLHLFCEVCLGVEHAHSKGVIHRDLKPTNVLASVECGGPRVKVIDFGIAKDLREAACAELTVAGEALGTPSYMSPEQAGGGELDTRSDIYSLGVLLHELLTGWLPQGPAAGPRRASRDLAANESSTDVARLRRTSVQRLASRLEGDLDWILLKALAHQPDDRYSTVAELRNDVERHLAALPVSARPPSLRDRAFKLARRNRLASGLVGVLALTVAAGLVFALVSLERTRAAERVAQSEARTAEQVTELLVGLFRANLPEAAKGRELSAKEVLERGRAQAKDQLAESPLLRARLLRTLSEVYGNLGDFAAARAAAEESVQASRTLQDDGADLAESLRRLGWVLRRLDEDELAESTYREALALTERLHGEDERTAAVLNELGLTLKYGAPAEALKLLQRARRIDLEAGGTEGTGILLSNIGSLQMQLRDFSAALAAFEEAAPAVRMQFGDDDPRVATMHANRALALTFLGRYPEAETALTAALELHRKLLGDSHPGVGQDLLELARVALRSGRLKTALDRAGNAVEVLDAALGTEHSLTRLARTIRAEALVLSGATEEARRDLDLVLNGPLDSDRQRSAVASAQLTLAGIERLEGDAGRALELAQRSLDSARRRSDTLQVEGALWSRAQTLAHARRPAAPVAYREALEATGRLARGAEVALQQARYFALWGCPQRSLELLERSVDLGLRTAVPRFEGALSEVRRSPRFDDIARNLGDGGRPPVRTGPIVFPADATHCASVD